MSRPALTPLLWTVVLVGCAGLDPAADERRPGTPPQGSEDGARLGWYAGTGPGPQAAAPLPPLTVGPQRASFAADTTTVDDGHADLEVGLGWDPRDLLDVPLNLNVGVGPRTEAYLSTSLWTIAAAPGPDARGPADVQLGLRHRFWDDDHGPTFALQPVLQLPTGDEDEGLGSGEVEAFLGAIVTLPVDDWTLTGFYQLGAIAEPGGSGRDTQHAASLIAGYRVHDGLGLYAELVGIHTPEQRLDELFVIAGVHHVLDERWMVDWGCQACLNDDAPPTQLIVGFTRALGRWRDDP